MNNGLNIAISWAAHNINLGIRGIVQVLDGNFNKLYLITTIKDSGYVDVRCLKICF